MKVENFKAKIIEIQLNPQDLLNDLVVNKNLFHGALV